MRSFIVGLALLASTPALAAEDQLNAMLRVTSEQVAILKFCSAAYRIDERVSFDISKVAHDAVLREVWPGNGEAEMTSELRKRFSEVEAAGPDQWCRTERARMAEQGVPIFKN
jgi:hypothetical protein